MIKTMLPRLAEIGKIKIGGKGEERTSKENSKKFRLPIKYDHFVITTNEKDAKGNFVIDTDIMKAIGNNSKEIEIRLLYDSIELNFLTSFSLYNGHKCWCRGDGEKAIRVFVDDKKKTTKKEIVCPAGECEYLINSKCKPSGLLSCLLPQSESIGGVYKFRTHSWNSVQNILSSLAFIQAKTGGKLANIPFKLSILKKATEEHGNVITVNLIFAGNDDDLKNAVIAETSRREKYKVDILKLENLAKKIGVADDNDDPADVYDEFYTPAEVVTVETRTEKINPKMFETPAIVEKNEPTEPQKNEDQIASLL